MNTNINIEPIQYIIFLVLIKLLIITLISMALANIRFFSRKLIEVDKSFKGRLSLALILSGVLVVSIILRHSANYQALDFTFAGLYIVGLLCGFTTSFISAIIVSVVLIFFTSEYYGVLVSFVSAIFGSFFYRDNVFINDKKFYKFSFGMIPVSILMAYLYRYAPDGTIFNLSNGTFAGDIIVALSDLMGVFLLMFLFRHHKTKIEFMNNESKLTEARLAILSSKINPHFLFNTLNTIASAVRINADVARDVVFKLSEILRHTFSTENEFRILNDEIDFIKNYLDIERVRFGQSRLSIDIEIDKKSKEAKIPTMIIQPIVENAIKHGIAGLVDKKGVILIKSVFFNDGKKDFIMIEVSDNGLGTDEIADKDLYKKGIGLSNVRDRLKLIYGNDAKLTFSSLKDQGTTVGIILPVRRWKNDKYFNCRR